MTGPEAARLAHSWAATAEACRRQRGVSPERMQALAHALSQLDQDALYVWTAERVAAALEGFAHVLDLRVETDATEDRDPTWQGEDRPGTTDP